MAQYVNDRPYAASSLLAVALGAVFSSALKGQCRARPELPARALPLVVRVPAVSARGGAELVRALFAPLGWDVAAAPVPLDERFPEWGDSRYVRLELTGRMPLARALRHLYVLLPVLDDAKHYWVGADEVDKLLRAGDGWLAAHPEQQLITSRYLARRRALTRAADERLELLRLAESDDRAAESVDNAVEGDAAGEAADGGSTTDASDGTVRPGNPPGDGAPVPEGPAERAEPLAVLRRAAVLAALREAKAARVLDLGCGEGQLVRELLADPAFTEIVGVDVSMRALTLAARRIGLDRLGERQAARVRLVQGSLAYTDARLTGYDAAVLGEVIEHVDEERLPALEYAVFGAARPGTVLVTTPNVEYNVRWPALPAGQVRHHDHRFEWDRGQFAAWAGQVAERYGYGVRHLPVGPDDPEVGPPTQLAVFTRREPAPEHTDGRAGKNPAGNPAGNPARTPAKNPCEDPGKSANPHTHEHTPEHTGRRPDGEAAA